MPPLGNVTDMATFSAFMEVGINKVIKNDLPTHKKLWSAWLTEKQATEYTEDYDAITGFGAMPEKPVGDVFVVDRPLKGTAKTFPLKPYGIGFVAEYELVRWDKYRIFGKMASRMLTSATDRKNVLGYSILNNGFLTTNSVYTVYNGEALFDATHELLRGGTAANAPAAAVALSYLGVQEMLIDFKVLPNEDGLYIHLEPKKLIVPPQKDWIVRTLLQSAYRPDNANRSKNTLEDEGLTYHCAPYLSSGDAWFATADKDQLEISFDVGDDNKVRRDFQFSTWNNVFSLYASYRVCVYTWYGTWGTTGV
jgi:hypothetical protein